MGLSATVLGSVAFQAFLLGFNEFDSDHVQPAYISRMLVRVISVGTLLCTVLDISFYQAILSKPALSLVSLFTLAIAPPIAGIVEGKRSIAGVYTPGRFASHLISNILGAVATASIMSIFVSIPEFSRFVLSFKSDSALNALLPFSVILVLGFIRWQQLTCSPNLDGLVAEGRMQDAQDSIRGYSLRHMHQLTNTLFLIATIFIVTGLYIHLFLLSAEQARTDRPLALTWQIVAAMMLVLAFLLLCGFPAARSSRTPFLIFLTGTPAALILMVIWLSLLQATTARNIFATTVMAGGFILYCAGVLLGSRHPGERIPRPHYLSAAAFTVTLTIALAGVFSGAISWISPQGGSQPTHTPGTTEGGYPVAIVLISATAVIGTVLLTLPWLKRYAKARLLERRMRDLSNITDPVLQRLILHAAHEQESLTEPLRGSAAEITWAGIEHE